MSEPTGTQYGGFWVRLVALLADLAIVFLVSAAVLIGASMALGLEAVVPAAFAVSVLAFLYWPVTHASRNQATLGKWIVGLKVARLDGRRISILRSLWREIMKLPSAATLMLGYLLCAFMPRKQALHDLLAASYVVKEGASGVVAAVGIAAAGFALPIFVGPMVGGTEVVSKLAPLAEGLIAEHAPMLEAALPTAVLDELKKFKPSPAPTQVAKAQIKPPKPPAPKAEAPKPAPVVEASKLDAPKSAPAVDAPKPEAPKPVSEAPMIAAQPEPVLLAEASPLPKPAATKAAKAKSTPAKPQKTPVKAVARATNPAPAQPKVASGMPHNDLMTAVLYRDADAVNQLLKLGKWVDKPDSNGATPLMVAAQLGDVRTAEVLLRAGADARRALPVAQERRDGEMLALLKRYK